jgi:hypothetical protein
LELFFHSSQSPSIPESSSPPSSSESSSESSSSSRSSSDIYGWHDLVYSIKALLVPLLSNLRLVGGIPSTFQTRLVDGLTYARRSQSIASVARSTSLWSGLSHPTQMMISSAWPRFMKQSRQSLNSVAPQRTLRGMAYNGLRLGLANSSTSCPCQASGPDGSDYERKVKVYEEGQEGYPRAKGGPPYDRQDGGIWPTFEYGQARSLLRDVHQPSSDRVSQPTSGQNRPPKHLD